MIGLGDAGVAADPAATPASTDVLAALESAGSALALDEALRAFDAGWLRHVTVQEQALFPALIEAMAGSDAVCLHELAERAALEHRAIDALRRRIDPAAETSSARVADLVACCRRHLAAEAAELMPMSARLLGDAETLDFARALHLGFTFG